MRAITLCELGSPEKFEEVDLPIRPPKSDEVLVQIKAGSINPIDCKIREGRVEAPLPIVLGHDCAGLVAAIGHDVRRLREGDEVWVYLGGPRSNGAYAEYTTVPHHFVSLKPHNLTFLEAAAIPVVGLTAFMAVKHKARPTFEDSVFVAGGSGGLGSVAIQLLQTFGISQFITTAGTEESVVYLSERFHLPADQIIQYRGRSRKDLAAEAIEKNGGRLFTKLLDFVGGDMKRLCFDLVAFDGEIVSVVEEIDPFAVPLWHGRPSPLFSKSASLHFFSLVARGLYGGQECWAPYYQDLEHLLRLFEQRRLRPVKMENLGNLSKETIARGHALLETGLVQGKLIFTVGEQLQIE
jgi:NADPH2:quinone reductase